MTYYYAYLWDRGPVSRHNRFVLAVENVMTTSGQALLAVLTESEEFAETAVSWYYGEGLFILREWGMCRQIRSTFLRNISGKAPCGSMILLYKKQYFSYSNGQLSLSVFQNGESPNFTNHTGENCKFGKIKAGDSALLCSNSLFANMAPEVILRKLNGAHQSGQALEPEEKLQISFDEIKRRIRSRGGKEEIAAIFIQTDKRK